VTVKPIGRWSLEAGDLQIFASGVESGVAGLALEIGLERGSLERCEDGSHNDSFCSVAVLEEVALRSEIVE
jgi:hypothetical protein